MSLAAIGTGHATGMHEFEGLAAGEVGDDKSVRRELLVPIGTQRGLEPRSDARTLREKLIAGSQIQEVSETRHRVGGELAADPVGGRDHHVELP